MALDLHSGQLMESPMVVPIVEGYGEVDAVPALVRRIAWEICERHAQVEAPIRVAASSFLRCLQPEAHQDHHKYFSKYVSLAADIAAEYGGFVLILLDCEDDCPAEIGPKIARYAADVRSDVKYLVTLAYREYETWFMFAAESLAGKSGLPEELSAPPHPEATRGAKGWLGSKMPNGYKETSHQVSMTAQFSLDAARRSNSFDRLVQRLCEHLR